MYGRDPSERNGGKIAGAKVAVHLLMAWVFLLAAIGFTGFVMYRLAIGLIPANASLPTQASSMVLLFGLFVAAVALMCWISLQLFLRCWFAYLRRLTPEIIERVERALPSVLAVNTMEPFYSEARSRYMPHKL